MAGINVDEIVAPSPNIQGGLWRAPRGTDLPTDTTTDLDDTDYKSTGFVDDDGVTLAIDRPSTDHYAWGGDLIASVQQHYAPTWTFKFYQVLDDEVLKAVHSDSNVVITPATATSGKITTVTFNAKLNINSVWVIDAFFQDQTIRWAMSNARVTQVGNIQITHKNLAVYPVTLKPFPDSNGNFVYQISDDGVFTA